MDKLGAFLPSKLSIPIEALDDLIKFVSNKTVGKCLKRIEICDDKNVLKIQIKELLYEEFRSFSDLLVALNYGLSVTEFKLTSKVKVEEKK
uniref:Uncharacterized protein n=1 Tax=viral metagenome TaxID=1070528 RepID=A0A6M3K5Y9_9ZZZZ